MPTHFRTLRCPTLSFLASPSPLNTMRYACKSGKELVLNRVSLKNTFVKLIDNITNQHRSAIPSTRKLEC